jgi:riboflavin kinase/FMN adenylyltransferase
MKTALTIGFFDGVHIGHQAILKKLRSHTFSTVLTFMNHPQEVLHPPAPELLISFAEKIKILQKYADDVVAVPFTLEYAATPFDELLSQFDLSHIILGEGAVFGKDRQGNEENVRNYGASRDIIVEYVPKLLFQDEPVSSSRIRKAIAAGNLVLAYQLLGKA